MAVELPRNPANGQIHKDGSRSWRFNGAEWSPTALLTTALRQNVDLPDLAISNTGTANQVLSVSGAGMAWVTPATPAASAVKAVYCGLRLRSTGPAAFEIGRGYCGSHDGGIIIHIDQPISADVSDALLDTGTLAASETYYVWIYVNDGTGGFAHGISLSRTNATPPHAHSRGRMVGIVETNADASGIDSFTMYNDGASKEIVTDSGTTTLNLAA